MTEHESRIIELTKQGLSARKIKERLHLDLNEKKINAVQTKHLGERSLETRSVTYQLGQLRPYIVQCMEWLGFDPFMCNVCDERQSIECQIHHTKYEGATLYDLVYACRSCQLSRENKGLK